MELLYWVEVYLVANLNITLVSLLSEEKEEVIEFLPSWLMFGSLFGLILVLCLLIDEVDWCRERRFWWK